MRRSEAGLRTRFSRVPCWLAVLILSTGAGTTVAADGKALYARCAVCHGARGGGVAAAGAPPLAGLDAPYIERQLKAFASGARGTRGGDDYGATMRAAVTPVLNSDSERAAVAAFISALARPPLPAGAAASVNGRNYFNAICSACHGGQGQGNVALSAPRLVGLPTSYMTRQLAAFKNGLRAYQQDDRYGAQMRAVAGMLPDAAAARDVLDYAASLRP